MRGYERERAGPDNKRDSDRLRRLENLRASEIPIDSIAAISAATDVQMALELLSLGTGGGEWGTITGTLADQLDLQAELDGKAAVAHTHDLDDLTDVDLTTTPPVDGDVLTFDGADWVPGEVGTLPFKGIFGRTLATLAVAAGGSSNLRLDNATLSYNDGSFTFPATTEVLVPASSGATRCDVSFSFRGASVVDQILGTIECWNGSAWEIVARHDTDTAGTDALSVAAVGVPVVAGTSKFRFAIFSATANTIDAGATFAVVMRGGAPAVGGPWALKGTGYAATGVWDQAVDGSASAVAFTDLDSSELLIHVNLATLSVSGVCQLQVSTDNGATWKTADADYGALAADGSGGGTIGGNMNLWSTNATLARSGEALIRFANMSGRVKLIERVNRALVTRFLANTSPINAVRVIPTGGGTINGGSVLVYGR